MSKKDVGIPLQSSSKRITIRTLQEKKGKDVIAALSIYDALHARLFDRAGGEVIIVGDSAAMTVQGLPNTYPMTMDQMITYAQSVRRGTDQLFVVGDMPLGSYEVSNEEAVRNALRFVKEAGCNAVKVETNMAYLERVEKIAQACSVVVHIGLNPNKAEMLGGYRTQGKTQKSYEELSQVIVGAEKAGACMVLIESVAEEISQELQKKVKIPVMGIAAGRHLDGQLVISSDLLGLYDWPGNPPIHFQKYFSTRNMITVGEITLNAFEWYVQGVKSRQFPSPENVHRLAAEEKEAIFRQTIE